MASKKNAAPAPVKTTAEFIAEMNIWMANFKASRETGWNFNISPIENFRNIYGIK